LLVLEPCLQSRRRAYARYLFLSPLLKVPIARASETQEGDHQCALAKGLAEGLTPTRLSPHTGSQSQKGSVKRRAASGRLWEGVRRRCRTGGGTEAGVGQRRLLGGRRKTNGLKTGAEAGEWGRRSAEEPRWHTPRQAGRAEGRAGVGSGCRGQGAESGGSEWGRQDRSVAARLNVRKASDGAAPTAPADVTTVHLRHRSSGIESVPD